MIVEVDQPRFRFRTVRRHPSNAFVPAPEPGAVLFANPADKMIYYYSEGMAAPMATSKAIARCHAR
ncbi:MAG TPA: hypothetical protein VN844_21155 [Pyrinomonadaceae bacterium]|nr:hypothetical protein [Pyrinomonadaceae bacterium]